MKLTNEEIARVFAMYWGQIILQQGTFDPVIINDSTIGASRYQGYHLLLTPLSDITDEHAIELTKILTPNRGTGRKEYIVDRKTRLNVEIWDIYKENGKEIKTIWCAVYIDDFTTSWETTRKTSYLALAIYTAFQYLTLEGYAVPLFFGIGHWANGKTAIELGIAIPNHQPCGT